jgi:hypothetical protein
MEFNNLNHLYKTLGTMTEENLLTAINYEVSTYKRRTLIQRMHSRYSKLRSARERMALIKGEMLL